MKAVTLDAGEEVDEVAGGASGMVVDSIGEIGDRASEGQAAGLCGTGFTPGSLARKGARGGMRGTGNKVIYDKELVEFGRMVKVTEGGQGRRLRVEGSERRMW